MFDISPEELFKLQAAVRAQFGEESKTAPVDAEQLMEDLIAEVNATDPHVPALPQLE